MINQFLATSDAVGSPGPAFRGSFLGSKIKPTDHRFNEPPDHRRPVERKPESIRLGPRGLPSHSDGVPTSLRQACGRVRTESMSRV